MSGVVRICAFAVCLPVVLGCGMNSAELSEHVMKEMQRDLVKTDGLKALKMKEVRLVKQDDTNYSGFGEGEIDGSPVKFSVKCQYDGHTVIWDAHPSGQSLAVLAAKEKAKETYSKIKASLPDIKSKMKEGYDAAAKKTAECCDAAAEKASSCLDAAKKKLEDIGKAVSE